MCDACNITSSELLNSLENIEQYHIDKVARYHSFLNDEEKDRLREIGKEFRDNRASLLVDDPDDPEYALRQHRAHEQLIRELKSLRNTGQKKKKMYEQLSIEEGPQEAEEAAEASPAVEGVVKKKKKNIKKNPAEKVFSYTPYGTGKTSFSIDYKAWEAQKEWAAQASQEGIAIQEDTSYETPDEDASTTEANKAEDTFEEDTSEEQPSDVKFDLDDLLESNYDNATEEGELTEAEENPDL